MIILSLRIQVPTGYDLLTSVHSWIYPDIQPVPEITGVGYLGRVYNIRDLQTSLIITQTEPGRALQVTHSMKDIRRNEIVRLVERTLGLKVEIESALDQMRQDPVLSPYVPAVEGIRPYMSPTPFEALMKTIIQQQISYKAANIFTKRMILGLVEPIHFKSGLWYSFPDAHTLMTTGINGLREFGFGYKAEYIHDVAQLVAKEELDLDSLVGIPFEEVFEILHPIRGIGEWTIRVLSLAGLGDFSVFAYNDLVIQKLLGKLFNNGIRMNSKQVREHTQTWGASGNMVLYLLMCAEVLGRINTKPSENS